MSFGGEVEKVFGRDGSDVAPHGAGSSELTSGVVVGEAVMKGVNAPVISYDGGWVFGADGLTPQDLAGLKPRRKSAAGVKRAERRFRPAGGNGGRYRTKQPVQLVEAPIRGEVIAKDSRIVIARISKGGALLIQQRFVKRKTATWKGYSEEVTERPWSVMVPEGVDAGRYLRSLGFTGGAAEMVERAIKLLEAF